MGWRGQINAGKNGPCYYDTGASCDEWTKSNVGNKRKTEKEGVTMKKIVVIGDSIAAGMYQGAVSSILDDFITDELTGMGFPGY